MFVQGFQWLSSQVIFLFFRKFYVRIGLLCCMANFNEAYEELNEVWQHYIKQGTHPWTYETAAADLPYQVGSIAKIMLQLKGLRYDEGLSKEELMISLADELADVMAETIFIAGEMGIDLDKAWKDMLKSDIKKITERSGKKIDVQLPE